MQLDPGLESLQDALREVVRAAGGAKAVGAKLWPTKPIALAQQRINDSLNPEHQQHFSDAEVLYLLRLGREVGCHTAMHWLADACGYAEPVPVETADERDALQRKFIAAAELKLWGQRIEALNARANIQAVR